MRTLFITLLSVITLSATAGIDDIIPTPTKVSVRDNKLVKANRVTTKITKTDSLSKVAEFYELISDKSGNVKILAHDERGIIWGLQTLEQLKDRDGKIPVVTIVDAPRYAIRGFMHDTGRNFMEVATLKAHIDLMSQYKLNTFQWHLTDNPGWRIESKAYPQLNDGQFQTRDNGKFYTYDQIRDVIAYAKARGVMVIPEIDIPGHSAYFDRTFGFGMASEQGMDILRRCFAEFFAEIPVSDCPYMHIGSDEIHINNPAEFMVFAQNLVRANGRTAVAWDPGLPTDDATVRQIWNPASQAAVNAKRSDFYDSSMGYLNYYDPIYFVRHLYHHQSPIGAIGGMLCLWNDVRAQDKSRIPVHSGMMPGIMAFAEHTWSGKGDNFGAFEERMMRNAALNLDGIPFYYSPSDDITWQLTIGDTVLDVRGGAVDIETLVLQHQLNLPDSTSVYATCRVTSDCDKVVDAWIGFETPARSNRISGGIPLNGQWENGSTIKINGVELTSPHIFNEPGAHRYDFHTWHTVENELPYTDEQFYWMRKPVKVALKKGVNVVEIQIKHQFANQRRNFSLIIL